MTDRINKAQGCLLSQLAGDALGSLVEFQSADEILYSYPDGVRELSDGGPWNTIAGQPTDDSELALLLARILVEKGCYDQDAALEAYRYWLASGPFDCGMTTSSGLRGNLNHDSQANGALMRISPLGIFGANYDLAQVAEWARQDAALTHPNPVCQDVNALFAMAIAYAVKNEIESAALYARILEWAKAMNADESVTTVIESAATEPPSDYLRHQGWVLIAFQNALWQLLHAPSLEEGVVDTVMRGGDTDTNACVCGALLGAVYGKDAVPEQWIKCLLNCRPESYNPRVYHPRPECFWPVDAMDLAEGLVACGCAG